MESNGVTRTNEATIFTQVKFEVQGVPEMKELSVY